MQAGDAGDQQVGLRLRAKDGTSEVWERNRLIARIEPGKDSD